jgi:thiosulfate dehydrogenase
LRIVRAFTFWFSSALVFAIALAGCTESAAQYGQSLFDDPSISSAASNRFRCSTCHEVVDPPQHVRPGYTLHDSVVRQGWWGGNVLTLLDAVNQCITNFMQGRALDSTDDKGRALFAYLQSISPDPSAPELSLTVVATLNYPDKNFIDIPSGDPGVGMQIWSDSCGNCHGAPHTGDGRIEPTASLVPDDSLANHGTDPNTGARPVVIEKVRHGKFFMVGGTMPLFSLEALSNDQLGAVLGYLEQFGLPPYSGLM